MNGIKEAYDTTHGGIAPREEPESALGAAWKSINPILRGAMDYSDFKAGWEAAKRHKDSLWVCDVCSGVHRQDSLAINRERDALKSLLLKMYNAPNDCQCDVSEETIAIWEAARIALDGSNAEALPNESKTEAASHQRKIETKVLLELVSEALEHIETYDDGMSSWMERARKQLNEIARKEEVCK